MNDSLAKRVKRDLGRRHPDGRKRECVWAEIFARLVFSRTGPGCLRFWYALLLAGLWLLVAISPSHLLAQSSLQLKKPGCLEQGSGALSGVLQRTVFPNPPEFDVVYDQDRPQVFWTLKLDRPVCVNTDGLWCSQASDPESEPQLNLGNLSDSDRARLKELVGKRVTVQGDLQCRPWGPTVTLLVQEVSAL